MSVSQNVREKVRAFKKGEPFATSQFLKFGSRNTIDQTLARLVKEGELQRVSNGVFVRPKMSRFTNCPILPSVSQVAKTVAKANAETIQVHAAEAAFRFKLTTQMPLKTIYYTNGSSRTLKVGNLSIRFVHTSSRNKLQHAGKKTGMALMALWYLGPENLNNKAIKQVQKILGFKDFETLCELKMPIWMRQAFEEYLKVAESV